MQHFIYHIQSEIPIDVVIDSNYGRLAATADATDGLQGVLEVFGVLANLYSKFSLNGFEDSPAALDVAGCSHTNPDNVPTLRRKAEGIIKSGNPVQLAQRHIEAFGGESQNRLR